MSNVPTIPSVSSGSDPFSMGLGYYLFMAVLTLLVFSAVIASKGEVLVSAAFASTAIAIIALWWWFKGRVRPGQPPVDEQ